QVAAGHAEFEVDGELGGVGGRADGDWEPVGDGGWLRGRAERGDQLDQIVPGPLVQDAVGRGHLERRAGHMGAHDAVAVAGGLLGGQCRLQCRDRCVLSRHHATLPWCRYTTWADSDAAMLAISWASAAGTATRSPVSRAAAERS